MSSDETPSPQDGPQSLHKPKTAPIVTVQALPRHDEESPLLQTPDANAASLSGPVTSVGAVIAVLLLGEFVSNADATLVMAAAAPISSSFDRLRDASWLSTGYTLGVIAAQPLSGKLSDIFGRKGLLQVSYLVFGLGCIISGLGVNLPEVITGRIVSGIGGAGIMTLGSIIITDIVPKRDIASWRALINVAITFGRSIGGPLGGWLNDAIGWRWLFLGQAPFVLISILLTQWKLSSLSRHQPSDSDSIVSKIKRIDFLGSATLSISVIAAIALADQGGKSFAWSSWQTIVLALAACVSLIVFIATEAFVAKEPVFNLRLFRKQNVAASYLVAFFQLMAQLAMMFSVPLYFQVVQSSSTTVAGAHMIPAVIGNTLGGIAAGIIISRLGRFKILLVASGLIGSVSFVALYLFWDQNVGFWESMYIIPGGFAAGMALGSSFVAMTAAIEPREIPMATSGYMLTMTMTMTAGVTMCNAVLGSEFSKQLHTRLERVPNGNSIIEGALADVGYISHLTGHVHEVVIECFIAALKHTYVASLICSLSASALAFLIRDRQL